MAVKSASINQRYLEGSGSTIKAVAGGCGIRFLSGFFSGNSSRQYTGITVYMIPEQHEKEKNTGYDRTGRTSPV
jgi:hypothetical protein